MGPAVAGAADAEVVPAQAPAGDPGTSVAARGPDRHRMPELALGTRQPVITAHMFDYELACFRMPSPILRAGE
ncbi:hypothetical protein Atai01_78520 [Amycolatopsis taiwanensis]|uniref:Uncharacterized protein n=1 Tax=Amycolatopsis taiwanensis TaxID=342230 RepID=A0A9W6R984_9PSEU|nr:hypothetical protein Atai01_78520 [Amycolatopsis taiwanensis]